MSGTGRGFAANVDTLGNLQVKIDGNVANDAFGYLRTTSPHTLFDSKQITNKQPLAWDDQLISGSGGASTYNTNEASTTLSVNASTTCTRARQTFLRFQYQPGKALRHGEPVLTPSGWINIEKIKIGDIVFDGLGSPTEVEGVYPQGIRQIFRVTFDDRTHVDCDGEHLWKTIIRQDGKLGKKNEIRVLSTLQMLEEHGSEPTLFGRWRIPAAPVLQIKNRPVSIDPYTLGAILGDGCISKGEYAGNIGFSSADDEIVSYLKESVVKCSGKYAYGISKMAPRLRELGLAGKDAYSKFIPDVYKYNSEDVRLGILQGLMDTDGGVDKHDGTASYTSVSEKLAEDLSYLVRSLGGQAKIKTRTTKYTNKHGERVNGALSYRVSVIMPVCPFKLERKAFYWKPRTRISFDRYIHTIKLIGEDQATCIRVKSEDHTFITRGHIVTHNSQRFLATGILGTPAVGITGRIGLFDERNGIFFESGPSSVNVVLRSYVTGAASDVMTIPQSAWNLDKLDGNGPSRVLADWSKTLIFGAFFEWLGVGSVWYFVVVGGVTILVHKMDHSNIETTVYMSTPNLPMRYEISNDGTGEAAALTHICCSVVSEGGAVETGFLRYVSRGTLPLTTLNNTNIYPLISFKLNDPGLCAHIDILGASLLCISNATYEWMLMLNPTVSGAALKFVAVPNSSLMADFSSTSSTTVSGGVVSSGGIVQQTTQNIDVALSASDFRLGSNISRTSDVLVLGVRRLIGTTEDFYAGMSWRETQ